MLGSNQRPLPCEGSKIDCRRFLEVAKSLQMIVFFREHFALVFRRFTRVAAQMLRLLHQHKVWDDQHLTCCLEANYASFVQGIFSEFR
jgi:hypothetical protein